MKLILSLLSLCEPPWVGLKDASSLKSVTKLRMSVRRAISNIFTVVLVLESYTLMCEVEFHFTDLIWVYSSKNIHERINFQRHWLSYITKFLFLYHSVIRTALPALVAERINIEMDNVKLLLNEHLRREKGNKNKWTLLIL